MGTETKSLQTFELQKDEFAYSALTAIEAYKPAQEQYSLKRIAMLHDAMKSMQTEEVRKKGEYQAARDNAVAAERDFHEVMLQAKNQVRAQFGESSNELQSLGLKKKSERRAPTRKAKGAA